MKLDIRRKVLLLVLSGSLLTFLLIAVFLTFGLYHAGTTLDRENEELGGEIVGFTEELVEAQIKKRMEEITRLRAQHVDRGLTATSADVKYLADVMNALLLQNYLQSEEDEMGAFLVVFMRRLGASLPIALVLSSYGFYAFWFVYPLAEIVTLIVLFIYKRSRGERHAIDPERVYSTAFLGRVEDMAAQIDAVTAFAAGRGADEKTCKTLRFAMEEICGLMNERAARQEDTPLLTQLTVIAQEDGTFKIHLRDDGEELDPFRLSGEQLSPVQDTDEDIDVRVRGVHVVKTLARQYLYRNYHGFNTITLTV